MCHSLRKYIGSTIRKVDIEMNLTMKRDSHLEQLIVNGYYYEAMKYIADLSAEDYFSILSSFAYDEQHLSVYSFSCFMYEKILSEEWHKFIIMLATTDLVGVDGMNYVEIYHTRELVKNNRTVENLSLLLEMNFCPDTCDLIDKSESMLIAEEILKYDKSERVANAYMEHLKQDNSVQSSYEENFVTCLEMGLYEKAVVFLNNMDGVSTHEFCVEYAKREQSIEIYCFVQYMINKTKSIEWMKTAIDVLTIGLESLKDFGVCDVALFYIRELENSRS